MWCALDFEVVEGTPAVPAEELDDEIRGVVGKMRRYAASFLKAARSMPDFTITPHPGQVWGQQGAVPTRPGMDCWWLAPSTASPLPRSARCGS